MEPGIPIPPTPFGYRDGPDGIYDRCFNGFSVCDRSLACLDFGADFFGTSDQRASNHFVTQFYRNSDEDELTVMLFGEVLGGCNGTGLGAQGAARYTEPSNVDVSKIRDVLTLGRPTGANEKLNLLFESQVTTLEDITKSYLLDEHSSASDRVRWVEFEGCEDYIRDATICVSLPYKHSDKEHCDSSEMDDDENLLKQSYDAHQMGDLDPGLNVDGVRLRQEPFFDEYATLTPLWLVPFMFRKGALVAVEAELFIHEFMGENTFGYFSQIKASRVTLLDPSPFEYKPEVLPSSVRKNTLPDNIFFDYCLTTNQTVGYQQHPNA